MRRRRSRAEAEELVREYESSGLSRQAFCAVHGLRVATLDKYRRQAAARKMSGSGGRLIAVEVMPSNSAGRTGAALCVELANGRRIGVDSGFDATTLERLLAVLEQA